MLRERLSAMTDDRRTYDVLSGSYPSSGWNEDDDDHTEDYRQH